VIDFHDAGENEPVKMRPQAADVGREFEREHGDGAIGEVNAGAADAGFLIESAARRDVLGDVGDVDLEFEIVVGKHTDEDGVVEVAGCFSVDGDNGKVAEVAAALEFTRRDSGGNLLRFFESGRGKMMREMELADHDFDVDAEIIFPAEDFCDASSRILRRRGPVGDFYIDHNAFEVGPVLIAGDFFS
jgi:hypothetical protein